MEHWEYFIGIIVQTLIFLAGGWSMVLKNKVTNDALKEQMKIMQEELKKLAEVVIQQAIQTTRIDGIADQFTLLHRTVEDLRRGNGFVKGRAGLDGEY